MKTHVRVYHYDMQDGRLVRKLCFLPREDDVKVAWAQGAYKEAFSLEIEAPNAEDHDILVRVCEQAFEQTQETGIARSTSVGDVIVVDERAHVVMPFGFLEIYF